MRRPTYAEVDLSAIRDNIKAIRARVGDRVKIMPAVKADGYGHGAVEISCAVIEAGADALGVACVEEAMELREAGISSPILILCCSTSSAADEIVRHNITATVCDLSFGKVLSDNAVKQDKTARVHIKMDTGMGRIGITTEQVIDFATRLSALPGVVVEGLFTHFPSSDEVDPSFTISQINIFKKAVAGLSRNNIHIPITHSSNSGGILAFPEADFDAVRPGIIVYGHYPSSDVSQSIPIREALTLKTKIVFMKEADAGATISYGRTHALKRRSIVATLPIGYADGYSRMLSNCGEAAVRGVRVPLIGRVCMDQVVIDVTEVPGAQTGDEVVLYGGGYDYLSVSSIADKIGTISYEVLCAISKRVPRVYLG